MHTSDRSLRYFYVVHFDVVACVGRIVSHVVLVTAITVVASDNGHSSRHQYIVVKTFTFYGHSFIYVFFFIYIDQCFN